MKNFRNECKLNLFKATGGVNHVFYKLILFYRVLTKFQVAFYCFKNQNSFEDITGQIQAAT